MEYGFAASHLRSGRQKRSSAAVNVVTNDFIARSAKAIDLSEHRNNRGVG